SLSQARPTSRSTPLSLPDALPIFGATGPASGSASAPGAGAAGVLSAEAAGDAGLLGASGAAGSSCGAGLKAGLATGAGGATAGAAGKACGWTSRAVIKLGAMLGRFASLDPGRPNSSSA